MKKYVYLIILAFAAFPVFGQYSPDFEANVTRGCVPLTITVSDLSGAEAAGIPVTYNYGSGFVEAKTFTYTTPGKYTITQRINTGGNPPTATRTKTDYIEVLPTPRPEFTVSYCEARRVFVNIFETTYEQYIIDFNDGTAPVTVSGNSSTPHTYPNTMQRNITVTGNYMPGGCGSGSSQLIIPLQSLIRPNLVELKTISNTQVEVSFVAFANHNYRISQRNINTGITANIASITNRSGQVNHVISGLDLTNNSYCFRVSAVDECSAAQGAEELCTVTVSATAQEDQNLLTWNVYNSEATFGSYIIYRNGQQLETINNLLTSSLIDDDVVCGANYCYYIVTELNFNSGSGNPVTSTSNESCAIATTSAIPPPIAELNSTIENNHVKLFWETDALVSDVNNFQIYRADGENDFQLLTTTNNNEFIDENVNIPANSYCYRVLYTNNCNLTSVESPMTCPISFTARQDRDNINAMSWSPYEGTWMEAGVVYTIELLDDGLNPYQTEIVGNTTSHAANQDPSAQLARYRIKAEFASNPTAVSYSNIVELQYRMGVFPPNTFTPNNDGLNDVFVVKGSFVKNFKISIFNKWGELVYQSTNMEEGWDGTINGKPPIAGAYAFMIEAEDHLGESYKQRGTVTIIF
ncbi:MAG: gliding motility-associated C-terminal domain-containing protein [Cytophagaceae bacterium]